MDLNTLEDVFREQIADIYSAESQLVEALPKVANAATDPKLRQALEEHLEQTRAHVERLDQIMGQVGQKVPTETCEGMKGLLSEGEKVIGMSGEAAAKDAAL
ncbi:MAG: YciE/YciF ferroxidase family protein, partial [Gaiellaceae bacterium]